MAIRMPKNDKWNKDGSLDSLLLFAQTLEEKLFDYTIDSFKAKALNLHSQVLELNAVASQVRDNRLSSGTLIPLVEEFEEQVKQDPVLEKHESDAFIEYAHRLEQVRTKADDFYALVRALELEFGGFYWERLLERISEEVRKTHNSRLLIALVDTFVSEAEIQGFHRAYLYYLTKKYFWRTKIDTADAIDGFLKYFCSNDRKFTFVVKARKEFLEMKEFGEYIETKIQSEVPEFGLTHPQAIDFLKSSTDYPAFLIVKDILSRDALSARLLVEELLGTIASVHVFNIHKDIESPPWYPVCLCIAEENKFEGLIKPQKTPIKHCWQEKVSDKKKEIKEYFEVIGGIHFAPQDGRIFLKVLDYHRAAVEANTPENQMIDLWAALEGFLPIPDPEQSRIRHYVSTLSPALTLTYPERLFQYTADSLSACDKSVTDLVQSTLPDHQFLEASVCLVLADEHEDRRKALYKLLAHHPILRFRCFSLHEQFHTSKRAYQTVMQHRRRVDWHIQRIYSTRNQIVHNAESLPYLETLVENLHSYVDILINSITEVGIKAKYRATLTGALKLLSMSEHIYLKQLQENDMNCDCSNYKDVVFGIHNPLSPFKNHFSIKSCEYIIRKTT